LELKAKVKAWGNDMLKVKQILILILLCSLTACFTVKSVEKKDEESCELVTKELEMDFNKDVSNGMISGKTDPRAMLPLLVVVPPLSFIVSGSVSVVGNAIHWIEKKGRCNDTEVQSFAEKEKETVVEKGGEVMDSGDNFAAWLKERNAKKSDYSSGE